MFKVTYELFGCPVTFARVFQTREETDRFVGLNHENFTMIKVVEVQH